MKRKGEDEVDKKEEDGRMSPKEMSARDTYHRQTVNKC